MTALAQRARHVDLTVAVATGQAEVHGRPSDRDDVAIEFAAEPMGRACPRHLMGAVPGGIHIGSLAPAEG